MRTLFWVAIGITVYTYLGYPAAIALLARLRPRPWNRQPWEPGATPPISVLMAVCDGGRRLETQIDHLLGLDPTLVQEIIVVSDGSTPESNAIFERQHSSRLKSILLPQRVGKSAALNHAIRAAGGEILLFVDVRPRILDHALTALLANFADSTVGCVAGDLVLGVDGHDPTSSAVSGVYWRYEQWIRNCEALVDSPVGVYGGFYAIRRSLATLAPPGLILDDMYQPLQVVRQGYRSVVDCDARVADSWPQQASGEFQRKVRTLAGNFQLIACAPWLLTTRNRLLFQLISHKLLRLLVPWALMLSLGLSCAFGTRSPAFAVFAALQLIFWGLAAFALKWKLPLIGRFASAASALLLLNAAAVAGLYTYLFTRGPLWKIWQPTPPPAAPAFASRSERTAE